MCGLFKEVLGLVKQIHGRFCSLLKQYEPCGAILGSYYYKPLIIQ